MLGALRVAQNGVHQATLVLQPEELGTVHATVTVADGTIVVHLVADDPSGHQVLRQSLPDLRTLLGQDGASVSLSLSSGGQSTPDRSFARRPTSSAPSSGADGVPDAAADGPLTTTTSSQANRLVDLRL